jgi:hypothetical protein
VWPPGGVEILGALMYFKKSLYLKVYLERRDMDDSRKGGRESLDLG